jgi:hypothetical protein
VSEGGGEDGGVAPLPYVCPPGDSSGLPGHFLSVGPHSLPPGVSSGTWTIPICYMDQPSVIDRCFDCKIT